MPNPKTTKFHQNLKQANLQNQTNKIQQSQHKRPTNNANIRISKSKTTKPNITNE